MGPSQRINVNDEAGERLLALMRQLDEREVKRIRNEPTRHKACYRANGTARMHCSPSPTGDKGEGIDVGYDRNSGGSRGETRCGALATGSVPAGVPTPTPDLRTTPRVGN